jgi:ATP-dependent protease ClpP protease subunit
MAAILNGGELTLSGDVGDYWGGDCFSYAQVVVALAQIDDDEDLTVRLNSGGGVATEGAAIHALLARRTGTTNIVVDGMAVSAASLIAMAGDTVTMTLGSYMMIHDPASITIGTSDDHLKTIEGLEALATAYSRVYAAKSGKTADECREIMKAETWFTAEQAVEAGFADASDEEKARPVAAFDYRLYAHAPKRFAAMAAKKNWRREDADTAATAASNRPTEEQSMTDTTNGGEGTADLAKATADAKNRIKAIMTSEEAKGREDLANHLAYDTDTAAEAAVAMLAKAPKASVETKQDDATAYEQRRLNGEGLSGGQAGGKTGATASANLLVTTMKKQLGVKEAV